MTLEVNEFLSCHAPLPGRKLENFKKGKRNDGFCLQLQILPQHHIYNSGKILQCPQPTLSRTGASHPHIRQWGFEKPSKFTILHSSRMAKIALCPLLKL